jgi:hypothetical protein
MGSLPCMGSLPFMSARAHDNGGGGGFGWEGEEDPVFVVN